ncbi:MAG: type III pantothenate kinase [Candidatus Omnitrophota bacterium]
MVMMRLLIDIGNSNTSIALVQGKKIIKRYFIATSRSRLEPGTFKRLLGKDHQEISSVIIVSVVPKFFTVIRNTIKTILPGTKIRTIGKDIKVPMKIKYKKPDQVGQDRLVTAFSAYTKKKRAVLVLDFGTAVTFDLVNDKGDYEGGLIFPGIRLALKALSENAALLPRTEFTYIKGIVGKDTKESIKIGMLLGYAAMCDGIIDRFKNKYGKDLEIIATGGDANLVAKRSSRINTKNIHPDLIFEGLNQLS